MNYLLQSKIIVGGNQEEANIMGKPLAITMQTLGDGKLEYITGLFHYAFHISAERRGQALARKPVARSLVKDLSFMEGIEPQRQTPVVLRRLVRPF